ncbi:substrate-binding periplasmic protein [Hahella ganghwensis]|uniref:substrate-binding periplasmic protein n=1 Tax=Hahella ganghwensis TaxID=286420 RepID=UPI00036777B3|nr:transporter substrate-binding domain-containing protein [Hahella ganghwensis]
MLRILNKGLIIIGIQFLSILLINPAAANPVKVCDDGAEWPPYIYYERENNQVNKDQLTGATKDLMDRIFSIAGLDYSVELIPWNRCLNEVKSGTRYEMLSNAGSNPERMVNYHRSLPIYSTTPGVFFSKAKFPQGVKLSGAGDLNQYKLCGIRGYNYEMYLKAGVKDEIDMGTDSAQATFSEVLSGRCDIFLSIIEPIFGAVAIGQYTLDSDLSHEAVPGIEPTKFYLWVSRNSPREALNNSPNQS